MSFISMKNISKTFNGTQALNKVNLILNYGEALCLAGQNGCGKSTLIKILSGIYNPDSGAEIRIGGNTYNNLNPELSIKKGIQVIYQDLALFPNLTVCENIAINNYRKTGFINQKKIRSIAKDAINSINADLELDSILETLPIAKQQLVAICRALAQNTKLLIMDEPTASLTAKEVKYLLDIVIKLKAKGISIIFVSHKLSEVMKVSDSVLVLKDGNMIGQYPISDITEKKLAFLMTGMELKKIKLEPYDFSKKKNTLEVKNLTYKNQYKNINFSLKEGEIISITGLLGSGRTELCLSLFGITQPDSGEIFINNQRVTFKSNRDAIKKGIAYVSEDRMNTGLIMTESIHNNIISSILEKISNKLNFIRNNISYKITNDLINSLNIKISNSDFEVNTLSGGNAQRVSIAKWIAINPKIIILDSPTIGVDIANKESIFNIIKSLSKRGISVIFITDEIEEAYFNSHKILIMQKGKIVKTFIPSTCSEQDIFEVVYEES